MLSIQSHAFGRVLADASGPALVLDVGGAVLLDANRAAAEIWTGGGALAALPMPLDAAMPALAALRRALDRDSTWATQDLRLTFWTVGGAQCWDAQIQPIEEMAADVVLVRLVANQAVSPELLDVSSQPKPELRHLMHELRTPLAAIQSLADVLQGGHLGPIVNATHRDYLASMRDTARHALDVIDAMLDPPSAGLREAAPHGFGLDLDAAVAEVAAGMSALAARSGARLSVVAGAQLPRIAAEGTAVRQMLINLVANSLAHAGDGVTVKLATGAGTEGRVWAEVIDNGPGLPVQVIERLAAGFPTEATAGIGRPQLGLSLTRSLAQANGGRLELFSGPDGARVRLVFAAYQPPGGDQVVASSSG